MTLTNTDSGKMNETPFINAATPLRLIFMINVAFIAALEIFMAPWWQDWKSVSSFLLLNFALGGAAGFTGGLLGFIFGVPRSPETAASQQAMAVNSNLVQISDWLTKLLVGASLAALSSVPGFAAKAVHYLDAGAYKGLPGGGTLALFILVFFLVLGFFWSYIETRTYITSLLAGNGNVNPKIML